MTNLLITYQNLWRKYEIMQKKTNMCDYTLFIENMALYQSNLLKHKLKNYESSQLNTDQRTKLCFFFIYKLL